MILVCWFIIKFARNFIPRTCSDVNWNTKCPLNGRTVRQRMLNSPVRNIYFRGLLPSLLTKPRVRHTSTSSGAKIHRHNFNDFQKKVSHSAIKFNFQGKPRRIIDARGFTAMACKRKTFQLSRSLFPSVRIEASNFPTRDCNNFNASEFRRGKEGRKERGGIQRKSNERLDYKRHRRANTLATGQELVYAAGIELERSGECAHARE